jgi:hypothetical protein
MDERGGGGGKPKTGKGGRDGMVIFTKGNEYGMVQS